MPSINNAHEPNNKNSPAERGPEYTSVVWI